MALWLVECVQAAGHPLNKFLVGEYGMTRSLIDPCLYTKGNGDDRLIVMVWVDDLCCASKSNAIFEKFFIEFSKAFKAPRR